MIGKALVLLFAVAASACASGPEDTAKGSVHEKYVRRCILGLRHAMSTNIEEGHLKPAWSVAVINWSSLGGYTMVGFEDDYDDPRAKDPAYIDDSINISCLLNDAGEIIHLSSPEMRDGVVRPIELVPPDREYEDETFDELVDAVRRGVDVYVYDAFYDLSGGEITRIGDVKVQRLDPRDYGE